jgi:peptidoglycan/xylan/chitin deacetylase (PgdA/CDA1 family)
MSQQRTRVIKRAAVIVAVVALTGGVLYVRAKYVLPIAMYHSVQPQVPAGNRLIVSTRTFDRQMAFLKKHRYNVLSLEAAARALAGHARIPARAVVVTFDDGNEDNYIYAYPILKKYGLPATIFVIVEDIGKPGRLTLAQIREMRASGLITFGSHSLTHPFLEQIDDPVRLHAEITGSRIQLAQLLGEPVNTFSYPCGRLSPAVRQLVQEAGYAAAVVTNPGKKCADDDVFALKRLRISENAAHMFIFWVEISGYYNVIRENRHK